MTFEFDTVAQAPDDAILGLNEAYARDPNPGKLNLGAGVYKDASGKTPILRSVKQAEARILENENTKTYLGIQGRLRIRPRRAGAGVWSESPVTTDRRATAVHTAPEEPARCAWLPTF